jgi:hypothetical protein
VDADKVMGVLLVQLAELAISLLTAFMLVRVGSRLLREFPHGRAIASLAAALWFVAPIGMRHAMNCLESGTYALAVLVVIDLISTRPTPGRCNIGDCIGLGLALGWAFWVRNDAVFLILAVCASHWVVGIWRWRFALVGRSLSEAIAIGLPTVILAAPWLYYNKTTFGYLMPISGLAESVEAELAQNLYLLPTKLFEYLTILVPIPQSLERSPFVIAVLSAFVIAALTATARALSRRDMWRHTATWTLSIYGVGIAGYYGLYFGAAHFMSRYMFPLSPFLALIGAAAVIHALDLLHRERPGHLARSLTIAMAIGLTAMASGLTALSYKRGSRHMHFQVVEWVAQHVRDDQWVGAIQTGTLGYFHDRTYNLDGKVNPEALEAKMAAAIPQYIVDKNIAFLVDWPGIADWVEHDELRGRYELVFNDVDRYLTVIARADLVDQARAPATADERP